MNGMGLWPRYFVLRALSARGRKPLIGKVFARVNSSWEGRLPVQFLQEVRQEGSKVTWPL